MKFTATKELDLFPIGDIVLAWDKKCRRKGTRVLIRDITILTDTRLNIDVEIKDKLITSMKHTGSELLTDGRKFYTTFGTAIQEIQHPEFDKALLKYRAEI